LTARGWYGWQTLAADAGAVLSIAAAVGLNKLEDECSAEGGHCEAYETGAIALLVLGAGTFVFGGPIVHFSHGYVGKGFGSLGMRLAAPAMFLLGAVNCDIFGSCPGAPLILAGLAAVPGAMALDAAWLAFEEADSDDPEPMRLNPVFDPTTRHVGLWLTTRF
jgi:hypothetical protein